MIFEKIEIGSFGKLDNMTLDLAEGVNIIRGGNESGKTTICNFIKFMFYGLPSSQSEKMKLISWRTGSCRGAITFRTEDGHRYRIERESIYVRTQDGKATISESKRIVDPQTGEIKFKGERPADVFLGVPENVFDSTVYIRQLYGTKAGEDTALCEAAENILFSGDESLNTKRALGNLQNVRQTLLYKRGKGGKIYELSEVSRELEDDLGAAQRSGGEIIYLEGTARQLRQKKAVTERQEEKLRAELDLYEAYTVKRAFLKYKEECRIKKELEKQIGDLRFAADHANAPVFSEEYIERLEKLRSDLQSAEVRLEEAQKRYDTAKQRVYEMREKIDLFERFGAGGSKERDEMVEHARTLDETLRKNAKIRKIALIASILAAFIAVGVMIGSLVAVPGLLPVAIALGVLALVSFAVIPVMMSRASGPKSDLKKICQTFGCASYKELKELAGAASSEEKVIGYIVDERDSASEAYRTASDTLDQINRELVTELDSANFATDKNTIASVDEALKICREQKNELEILELKLEECAARISNIEESLSTRDEEYIKSACTATYDDAAMEAFDYNQRRREYDTVQSAIRAQTEKLHNIEKELAALLAMNPHPSEIAAKKEELDAQIKKLTEKHDAIELAIDSIMSASTKLRDGLAPKLAKGASAIMGKLSDGKYKTLGVNSEFGMTFTDSAATHSVEYLSAGTSDIAYISLRMALVDLLYKKSVPPFVFDESFMRMDNARMTSSLKLLCELGEGGTQSLLFTCHGREEKLMRTIGEYTYYTI